MARRTKNLTAGALLKVLRKLPVGTPLMIVDGEGEGEIPITDLAVIKDDHHNPICVYVTGNFHWTGDEEEDEEEEGDKNLEGLPYGDPAALAEAMADLARASGCATEQPSNEPDCVNQNEYPFLQSA